mgnify:CR=1 FL=1
MTLSHTVEYPRKFIGEHGRRTAAYIELAEGVTGVGDCIDLFSQAVEIMGGAVFPEQDPVKGAERAEHRTVRDMQVEQVLPR